MKPTDNDNRSRVSSQRQQEKAEDILFGATSSRYSTAVPDPQYDRVVTGYGTINHLNADRQVTKIELLEGHQVSLPVNSEGAMISMSGAACTLHYDADGNLHREDGPAIEFVHRRRFPGRVFKSKGSYWLRGKSLATKREWKQALAGRHPYYQDRLVADLG